MQGHPAEGGVGEGKDLQSEPVAAAGVAALQVSPALQSYQQGMRGAFRQSKAERDFGEPQAARRLREHFQNRERPIHGGGELFREPAMCPCDPKQLYRIYTLRGATELSNAHDPKQIEFLDITASRPALVRE